MSRGNTLFISSIIVIRGSTCLSAEDTAMYFASTVLGAITICKELRQEVGQLVYMITIPVLDMKLSASLASACCQYAPHGEVFAHFGTRYLIFYIGGIYFRISHSQ